MGQSQTTIIPFHKENGDSFFIYFCSFLRLRDICVASIVCQTWKNSFNNSILWKHYQSVYFNSKNGLITKIGCGDMNWKAKITRPIFFVSEKVKFMHTYKAMKKDFVASCMVAIKDLKEACSKPMSFHEKSIIESIIENSRHFISLFEAEKFEELAIKQSEMIESIKRLLGLL